MVGSIIQVSYWMPQRDLVSEEAFLRSVSGCHPAINLNKGEGNDPDDSGDDKAASYFAQVLRPVYRRPPLRRLLADFSNFAASKREVSTSGERPARQFLS